MIHAAGFATEFNTVMLVLRVVAGVTLFLHGYNKVFRGGKIEAVGGLDTVIPAGMKPGRLNAWMAASTEMGAGVLLTVGLLTPFAAAGLIGIMVVAARTDHRGSVFMFKNGWESVMVLGVLGWGIGAAVAAAVASPPAATTSASRPSTRSSSRWTASRPPTRSSSSPRPTAPTCSIPRSPARAASTASWP